MPTLIGVGLIFLAGWWLRGKITNKDEITEHEKSQFQYLYKSLKQINNIANEALRMPVQSPENHRHTLKRIQKATQRIQRKEQHLRNKKR